MALGFISPVSIFGLRAGEPLPDRNRRVSEQVLLELLEPALHESLALSLWFRGVLHVRSIGGEPEVSSRSRMILFPATLAAFRRREVPLSGRFGRRPVPQGFGSCGAFPYFDFARPAVNAPEVGSEGLVLVAEGEGNPYGGQEEKQNGQNCGNSLH